MANEIDERIASIEGRATRLAAWLSFFAGGVLGVLGTVAASYFGYLNRDRELDLELAKLSLGILAGDYKEDANYLPARRFAINGLEKGTGVTISEEDKKDWASSGLVPTSFLKGAIFMDNDWFGDGKLSVMDGVKMGSEKTHAQAMLDLLTPDIGQFICLDVDAIRQCGPVVAIDTTKSVACVDIGDGSKTCGLYVSDGQTGNAGDTE